MRVMARGQLETVTTIFFSVLLLLLLVSVEDETRPEAKYINYRYSTHGPVYEKSYEGRIEVMSTINVTTAVHNKVSRGIARKKVVTEERTNQSGYLNFPIFPSSIPNIYLHNTPLSTYRNPLLTFVHNPKSGGTTLKACLRQISKKDNKRLSPFITTDNRLRLETDFLSGLYDWKSVDLAAGGDSMGICENIATPRRRCAYYTIVREPLDRMISHYFFCKGGGQTNLPCHNKTIDEYAMDIGTIFFRQLLTQVKCGPRKSEQKEMEHQCHRKMYAEYTAGNDELVNYFVQKLDSFFAVIGLTEEYDTSLALFQDAFKLRFHENCSGLKFNTAPIGSPNSEAKQKHELDKAEAKKRLLANETIQRILRPDVVLYKKAKEIFQRQKQMFMAKKKIKKLET